MSTQPLTFAGRVVKKYGRTMDNDYDPVNKFFTEMGQFLSTLNGIPFSAVEDLEKYEINRDVMINIMKRIFRIFDAANVNMIDEMKRMATDHTFDGLEADVAKKKAQNTNNKEVANEA